MYLDVPYTELLRAESPENSYLPAKYFYKIGELQQQILISECFSFLLHNSKTMDVWMLKILEQQGIVIGNGAFALLKVRLSVPFFPRMPKIDALPASERREDWPDEDTLLQFVDSIRCELGSLCRAYLFSDCGYIYVLLCMQGETSRDLEEYSAFFQRLGTAAERIRQAAVRLLHQEAVIHVSNVHFTVHEISSTFEELNLLQEYAQFCLDIPKILFLWEYRNNAVTQENIFNMQRQYTNRLIAALRSQTDSVTSADEIELSVTRLADTVIGTFPCNLSLLRDRTDKLFRSLLLNMEANSLIGISFKEETNVDSITEKCRDEAALRSVIREFVLSARQGYISLTTQVTTAKLLQAKELVDKNICDPTLSVASVAEQFSISRPTLSAKFCELFGCGMSKYIQEVRVSKAKSMMKENPKMTLKEIAEHSGFGAISTMYRAFKRLENVAPGTFMQRSV